MKCQQKRPFQQNSSLRALSKFPFTCNTNFGVYKCPPLVITLKGSCKLLCILCIVMYLMCCIIQWLYYTVTPVFCCRLLREGPTPWQRQQQLSYPRPAACRKRAPSTTSWVACPVCLNCPAGFPTLAQSPRLLSSSTQVQQWA